ncbi:hypothetical protein ES703_115987 [subsurface metagenome]
MEAADVASDVHGEAADVAGLAEGVGEEDVGGIEVPGSSLSGGERVEPETRELGDEAADGNLEGGTRVRRDSPSSCVHAAAVVGVRDAGDRAGCFGVDLGLELHGTVLWQKKRHRPVPRGSGKTGRAPSSRDAAPLERLQSRQRRGKLDGAEDGRASAGESQEETTKEERRKAVRRRSGCRRHHTMMGCGVVHSPIRWMGKEGGLGGTWGLWFPPEAEGRVAEAGLPAPGPDGVRGAAIR